MRLDVFTQVPHAFGWLTEQKPLATVLGTELELRLCNYRDTTPLRAGQVDDTPYGGGAGMVLRVDVVAAALDAVYGAERPSRVIALTPQGRQLDQTLVEELAAEPAVAVLSSRFEGFDARIVDHLCTEAISIGPYVLSGGELPAMVLLDAVARRLPGALADGSGEHESFSVALDGGVEYPHYTRPPSFRGWDVPDVLLSGNHAHIDAWRAEQSRERSIATPLGGGYDVGLAVAERSHDGSIVTPLGGGYDVGLAVAERSHDGSIVTPLGGGYDVGLAVAERSHDGSIA